MTADSDVALVVLIQAESGCADQVVARAAALPGVITADAVTGPYDAVVMLDGSAAAAASRQQLLGMDGVDRVLTCPTSGNRQVAAAHA